MTRRAGFCKRSQRILEAAGYRVTPTEGSLYEWDLIGVNASGVVFVRVCEQNWPEEHVREHLYDCPAPASSCKILHRWTAGKQWPEVRALP